MRINILCGGKVMVTKRAVFHKLGYFSQKFNVEFAFSVHAWTPWHELHAHTVWATVALFIFRQFSYARFSFIFRMFAAECNNLFRLLPFNCTLICYGNIWRCIMYCINWASSFQSFILFFNGEFISMIRSSMISNSLL